MLQLARQIEAASQVIRSRWSKTPRAAIILGSGQGSLAEDLTVDVRFDYGEIPNFIRSTAIGHKGQLVCGQLEDVPVVAYQGRFHLYEGYTPQQAAMPVRLSKELGANTLIVSNAAGGINPVYAVGDLVVIDDHINFMFANPLVGVNDDRLGPRFPDMSRPYDCELISLAKETARRQNFVLHRGVYAGMLGPNYETRAEYRMARQMGGDVVGMSTVPEVIAAVHAGMRILGLSTVTNIGFPDAPSCTDGHDVIAAAATVADKLATIVHSIVKSLRG